MLEHTINSMKSLTSKELATIALGLAKMFKMYWTQENKNKNSIYHQSFFNVLLDDSSNPQASFFHPITKASSCIMQLFDSHCLVCLSYTYALLGYNLQFGDVTSMFGDIASRTIKKWIVLIHQACRMYYFPLQFVGVATQSSPIGGKCCGLHVRMEWNAFNAKNILDIVQAYITFEESHSGLFKKIAKYIVNLHDITSFKPPELSTITWTYPNLNEPHHDFLWMIGDSIVALNLNLSAIQPPELTQTKWAFAALIYNILVYSQKL